MRKKLVSVICILTLAVLSLCGCGSKQESTGGTQTGQSKEINVMIWDSTYPDEVFDQFEEETGIHVNVSYITNTDELITQMVSGENEFDYVDVESAYVKTFVENGLLAKIDYDKIPNSE
ncbi:MAG: PotD/PotF family extracellular solute-binding protein, partial [Roseburia sp.]|nr:PotD/PotF family extracellular solute-binding protein [Roseburia sp.]